MPVKSDRQKRRRKPFTREQLFDDSVLLPGGTVLRVRVTHHVEDGLRSFLDFDSVFGGWPPIEHHFTVSAEDFGGDEALTDVQQAALIALAPPLDSSHYAPIPAEEPRDVVLAALHVTEYPERWLNKARTSWYDAIDGTETGSGDGWVLTIVMGIEELTEKGECLSLIDGSLFVYRMLEVHPELRGQALGPRLMAHALASLLRTSTDASVCVAYPESTRWDPFDPTDHGRLRGPRTPEAVEKLIQTYERLGFKRWKRVGPGKPTPMWVAHEWRSPLDLPNE